MVVGEKKALGSFIEIGDRKRFQIWVEERA
jgi:hypothetical protein